MKHSVPPPRNLSNWLPWLLFTGALAGVSVWIAQAWLAPPPPSRTTATLPQPGFYQPFRVQQTVPGQPGSTFLEPLHTHLSAEKAALLEHPATRQYVQQLALQQSLQQFFTEAESMTLEQRQQQAEQIRQDLNKATEEGHASAGERLLVELALLPLTLENEAEREDARLTLKQHYQEQYDQAMARWQAAAAPQLASYREQQQRIVADVMAREDFTSRQKRDRYLQKQLQLARERIYRQDPD
ncbi:MAG: hypothetical protein EA349_06195 [Halomonadaceae bacterium]|nr:MAG: hypothetical protein EA349_06195 [Halomonadaceae bacterium]